MDTALPRRWKFAILAAAGASFVCKLTLALRTFGTNDVYAWERFAHWSALFGANLYSIDPAFNHPPSMIHALALMQWLAKATGIFFPFWLRLPAIVADCGSLWVVWRMFSDRLGETLVRWSLLLLALSPALILISGFHGNTDPVVMFFLLLAVWLSQENRDWQAGLAFGLAMCVKILPVIVLPVLLFGRPGLRSKAVFAGAAGVVMVFCWTPYLFQNPAGILHQVIGYQSIYGHWGLSWIACHLTFFRDSWHDAYWHYGSYAAIGTIAIAAFVLNRRENKPSLYTQTGAAFFFFLAVASGFGVQYLAWLVPWTIGLGAVPVTFFTLASGAFLLAVYNFWSGGFPWFLADSNYAGDFSGHMDYLLVLCWLSVVVLAAAAWKRKQTLPTARVRLAWGAAALLIILFPLWKQVERVDARHYPASEDHAALTGIHARAQAGLSDQYYKMARYTDAAVAARTGVAMNAQVPEAWTSLARACSRLGRREEALNAAYNAIQLAPDDAAANAVLTEALGRPGY